MGLADTVNGAYFCAKQYLSGRAIALAEQAFHPIIYGASGELPEFLVEDLNNLRNVDGKSAQIVEEMKCIRTSFEVNFLLSHYCEFGNQKVLYDTQFKVKQEFNSVIGISKTKGYLVDVVGAIGSNLTDGDSVKPKDESTGKVGESIGAVGGVSGLDTLESEIAITSNDESLDADSDRSKAGSSKRYSRPKNGYFLDFLKFSYSDTMRLLTEVLTGQTYVPDDREGVVAIGLFGKRIMSSTEYGYYLSNSGEKYLNEQKDRVAKLFDVVSLMTSSEAVQSFFKEQQIHPGAYFVNHHIFSTDLFKYCVPAFFIGKDLGNRVNELFKDRLNSLQNKKNPVRKFVCMI